MVVSKGVPPSATHFCQGHLNRVPHVSSFPLKHVPGRQLDRAHGSGRLCQHKLKVPHTALLLMRLSDFASIEVLQFSCFQQA